MKFNVGQLVDATGGRLLMGNRDAQAGEVVTDSRALCAGQTFLALKGETFDGHAFVPEALGRGAACLIVRDGFQMPALAASTRPVAAVAVADTTRALADLGRAARARVTCPVIGITGSCGKTTVKEMVGQILGRRLRGKRPPKSFNNQIGVPLTLLAADEDDQFVLCELGTNAPGEIAHLASIARPTIGVVTCCEPVHLEGLGSVDGVAEEKAALVDALPEGGVAVLNADDPRVAAMTKRCRGRTVTVGFSEEAHLMAEDLIQTEQGLNFTCTGGVGFELPLLGRHNAVLALAAAAAAWELGVALDESAEALRNFQPPPMRLQVEETGGVVLINDAYNANPASMRAALELVALWPDRRKIFYCGAMRELGAFGPEAHAALGRMVVEVGIDRLVCVGPEAQAAANAAVDAGMDPGAVAWADTAAAAARQVGRLVRTGDVVLVKGSRAVHMELVAEAVAEGRRADARG
jgi:UDP-N-acetylmuramoyl-tripeptide--D-alanyl-D-alanine ligase